MKKFVKGIIITFIMISLFICGCSKKNEEKEIREEKEVSQINYEELYNKFIKQEVVTKKRFASLNDVQFELESDENSPIVALGQITNINLGVIGGYIVDLDENKIPELILSYVDETDVNLGMLMLEVYTVIDEKVLKVESDTGSIGYEFFYNKSQGNLHVFLQEVDGKSTINVLKAFERSFGTLCYDVVFDIYSMEDGRLSQKVHSAMITDEDYRGQAEKMVPSDYNLGSWIEDDFEKGIGEDGTNVFAPYDFKLSEKDYSLKEVIRIRAAREYEIQSFQYYDYSKLRERIGFEKAYNDLLVQDIIPSMGIASSEFNTWENLYLDETVGSINEEYLGFINALEYDSDVDGVLDLLVFYVKQEMQPLGQKLYIDLYTQIDDEAVFVGNVDILESVHPWSSVFALEDLLSAGIKTHEGNTYLYINRQSDNEGPDQTIYYIYNLTNMESIEKCVYYMPITDGGRLNGELMIPSIANGGSSDEHEFVAKVENGEIELYYEAFRGERDETLGEMKCQSFLEAEKLIESELLAFGLDLTAHDEGMTEILEWNYGSGDIQIYDKTPFCVYSKSEDVVAETEEIIQSQKKMQEESQVQKNDLEESLCGAWLVDVEKFNEENSDSFAYAFGTSIKYGYKMTFSENGDFSYYIAAGIGGEGSYSQQGDQILTNITTYEEGNKEELVFQIMEEDGKTYIVTNDYGYQVYWYKQQVEMSIEEICQRVTDYYNNINNTDIYVCFSGESKETTDGYSLILRRQNVNEANGLVGIIYVNIYTGEVEDEWGNQWFL